MDALVPRVIHLGLVPFHQQLMALRRRQERKLANFLFRIGGYSFEQRPQVAEHPPRRIVINSVAIKKNFQLQFGTIID